MKLKKNGEISHQGEGGGAPIKYTDNFIEDIRVKLETWIQDPLNWFITDFAISQDLWEQRIYDFANRSELFLETLKKAQQVQLSRLVNMGLARKVDTGMAIFTLKNVAGWRDKKEFEHSGEIKVGMRSLIEHVYTRSENERAGQKTPRRLA